jgi:hypothetical protein
MHGKDMERISAACMKDAAKPIAASHMRSDQKYPEQSFLWRNY